MADWSQYRKSPIQQFQEKPSENTSPMENQWSQYSVKPKEKEIIPEEETLGSKILSGTTKTLARGLEGVYGLPGDIESFARPFIASGQEGKGGLVGKLSEKRIFPTSSELRELSKESLKGQLEPSNETERVIGEFGQDYVFTPGGPWKKIALAGLGVGTQEAVKAFGGTEDEQSKAKAAATFLGNFIGKKNVKDYYKNQYTKASRAMNPKEVLDSKRLHTALTHLENNMKKGVSIPSKDPGFKVISELKEKAASGNIHVKELDAAFHNINEYLFDKKNLPPKAERWLQKTKKMVGHELKRYGKKNPKYLEAFKNANDAYAGLAQSQKASNFIHNWKKSAAALGATGLLAEYIIHGKDATIEKTGKLTAAYGVVKGYELINRIFQNKTLFHYYTKALGAAAKENAGQFAHNLSKLDENLRKQNLETSRIADFIRRKKEEQNQ